MPWDLSGEGPIYLQLVTQIEKMILSGEYPPGGKCPTVRELACTAAVNPNTMQKALQELERKGLIINNRTNGRTITEDKNLLHQMKIGLAKEYLDDFLTNMNQLGYSDQEKKDFIMKELNQ